MLSVVRTVRLAQYLLPIGGCLRDYILTMLLKAGNMVTWTFGFEHGIIPLYIACPAGRQDREFSGDID